MPTSFATAAALFHSVGVNTRLNYFNLNYGNVPLVVSQLKALGVAHVRDGLHSTVTGQSPANYDMDSVLYAAWREIGALGIRFDAVVDPDESLGNITSAILNQLWFESGMLIESLEGPNEMDVRMAGWPAVLAPFQKTLYGAAKSMAQEVGPMAVVGPSLANAGSGNQLGSLASWLDYGNLHPYPAGQMPTCIFPSQIGYGALVSGSKPIMATESGYHNAVNQAGGQPGVSEAAAAQYVLRMLLDNFANGIVRTYIYELQDEGDDPSLGNVSDAWGLVRWDGTYKPAFHAVSNLLALLGRDTAAPLSGLAYTLSGAFVSALLVQQTERSWLLFLWQEVPVYDLATNADIAVAPVNVTLTIPTGMTAEVYMPLAQRGPVACVNQAAIALAVPAHPLAVLIAD